VPPPPKGKADCTLCWSSKCVFFDGNHTFPVIIFNARLYSIRRIQASALRTYSPLPPPSANTEPSHDFSAVSDLNRRFFSNSSFSFFPPPDPTCFLRFARPCLLRNAALTSDQVLLACCFFSQDLVALREPPFGWTSFSRIVKARIPARPPLLVNAVSLSDGFFVRT